MRATTNRTKPAAKRAAKPYLVAAPRPSADVKRPTTKKARRVAPKRTNVPFDEMCRLMKVYGPIKCLRRRQSPDGGGGCTKVQSVKRKFYRWFPDLEARFVKDEGGFYRPKFGHEFEMRYRQEMRRKDGEMLNRKRARKRQQPVDEFAGAAVANSKRAFTSSILADVATSAPISAVPPPSPAESEQAFVWSILADTATLAMADRTPVSPATPYAVTPMPSFPDRYGAGAGDKLKFDHELLTAATIAASAVVKKDFDHVHAASAPVAAEVEPLCRSFIVDQGIFDDVDESFFGFEKNLDYPESDIGRNRF